MTASNLQTGARLALIGLSVNIGFAVAKITAGIFGHAELSLVAEQVEIAIEARLPEAEIRARAAALLEALHPIVDAGKQR